ncbi:NAD(P)/FAD-dependent oxidoreductase [Saccharopolyspora sp. NFXS83]|uniref:NAD(P)/FAD-dependent oxidoreductase n=1 Tax=Saccharopolyspora sp. NFXS83 TaxID=2993560 RepID=UPI00224A5E03|nr:NAD(P)/FAD-dependent oxidoreductase [Saccharopolyspora sp. NFXS83]MCX2732649.1 NAD(P)/FAD-dependent oxidoreductase [Saccharopolyspora sp. NFXS83]
MSEQTTRSGRYDAVIIGGGAAGASAALTLARARRRVLVIDSGAPRNAPAGHVHNYLGREGTPPRELVADGRAEATGYGAEFTDATATTTTRTPGGTIQVALDDATTITTARLLITTGLADDLPDIDGLAPRWGRDVLHCPYCHGWEARDQHIVVLGTGPLAAHQALLWRQWSPRITLLHTAELTTDDHARLHARGITTRPGTAERVVTTDDHLRGIVVDGEILTCDAVVTAPRFTVRADPFTGLGLHTEPVERDGVVLGDRIPTDATGATRVPGVWAAGNVTDPMDTVIGSAAAGVRAAMAINADLVDTDTRTALTTEPFGARQERDVSRRVLADRRHGL